MSSPLLRNAILHSSRARRSLSTTAARASTSTASTPSPVSSSSQPFEPDISLPPKKMRALVELFHTSANFISRENLDLAIDQAFINSRSDYLSGIVESEQSLRDLVSTAKKRRQMPKLGSAKIDTFDKMDATWSAMETSRETKLQEALFGATRGRPGLDALKEEAPRILAFKEDDRRSQVRVYAFSCPTSVHLCFTGLLKFLCNIG